MFVKDHEIDGELLHPQIFVRMKQLSGDVELVGVGDAQKHDRQVAGNSQGPKSGLCADTSKDGVRGRPQCRSRVDEVSGETLEQACLARIDAEMVELHLGLGPGERCRPFEGSGVAMLVDEVKQRFPRGCNQGPKGDLDDRTGCDSHAPAQGEDRVKHGTHRVRERPTVDHCNRRSDAAAAVDEPGPIGFHLRLSHGAAVVDSEVSSPDFRLSRRTPSPRRQNGADFGQILSLDEQLGKGRMRHVGGLGP